MTPNAGCVDKIGTSLNLTIGDIYLLVVEKVKIQQICTSSFDEKDLIARC